MSFDPTSEAYGLDPALIEVRRLSETETGRFGPYEIGTSLPFNRVRDWTIAEMVWVPSRKGPDEILHSTILFRTQTGEIVFYSHDGSVETRRATLAEALEPATDLLRLEASQGIWTG